MPTMEVKSNFKFRVNVSNDYYVKKTDASACLSLAGAKAIKKVKMAFREQDVTVDEFLTYALNGYAFCNLFDFDPDQSYWFETGDGHRYQTTPLYKLLRFLSYLYIFPVYYFTYGSEVNGSGSCFSRDPATGSFNDKIPSETFLYYGAFRTRNALDFLRN